VPNRYPPYHSHIAEIQMPAGKRKTIEQCSNQEVYALLIVGTTICLIILAASFRATYQPEWFLWIGCSFALVWIAHAWYCSLRELRKRVNKN